MEEIRESELLETHTTSQNVHTSAYERKSTHITSEVLGLAEDYIIDSEFALEGRLELLDARLVRLEFEEPTNSKITVNTSRAHRK